MHGLFSKWNYPAMKKKKEKHQWSRWGNKQM